MGQPLPRLHGIPNCDTVKRARAWLAAQGVDHEFHDFKRDGVPPLEPWAAVVGIEALLNRRGTTWRKLSPAEQACAVDQASIVALLQAQPSLIKRPVVLWPGGALTVGFDGADWTRRVAALKR